MLFLTGIYFIPVLIITDVIYIYKNKNLSMYRKVVIILGSVYLLMLVDVVFLPFPINSEALNYVQNFGFGSYLKSMNFIPFASSMSAKQAIQNFVLLLPLGVILPLVKRDVSNVCSVCILVITPLMIEIIQGSGSILLKGYWKSLDINDFLLNSLGALVGLILIRWVIKKNSRFFDRTYWKTYSVKR